MGMADQASIASYYGDIWREGREETYRLCRRWLPLEIAMTLGPIGVAAAIVLPPWPIPHASGQEGGLILAAMSAGLLLLALILLTVIWAFVLAPVKLARADAERAEQFQGEIAELNERVTTLEEEKKPRLELSPDSMQEELGEATFAVLRVRNAGLEMVEDCYCRLVNLVYRCGYINNGEPVSWWQQRFTNEDIYFRWRGRDLHDPHRSFREEAILEIVAASPGWSRLSPVGERGFQLINGELHRITLEVGAKNSPAIIETFNIEMRSNSTWTDENGVLPILSPQPAPEAIFEKLEPSAEADTMLTPTPCPESDPGKASPAPQQ